jgi:hypothetical protein
MPDFPGCFLAIAAGKEKSALKISWERKPAKSGKEPSVWEMRSDQIGKC